MKNVVQFNRGPIVEDFKEMSYFISIYIYIIYIYIYGDCVATGASVFAQIYLIIL